MTLKNLSRSLSAFINTVVAIKCFYLKQSGNCSFFAKQSECLLLEKAMLDAKNIKSNGPLGP